MRVTCLTESLGSGGAERQLCTLAVQLKHRGIDVSILTYSERDFFLPMIQEAGIEFACVPCSSRLQRARFVRHALRSGKQDVVLAFLKGPASYAELAAIPRRDWGLVVSERSPIPGSHKGWRRWRRILHRMADYVTSNSHTNRLMIERSVPGMKGRVVTIYNSVDLDHFTPPAVYPVSPRGQLNLVGVGSYVGVKNILGLVRAISLVRRRSPSLKVQLDWYGGHPLQSGTNPIHDTFEDITDLIRGLGLQDCVRLHETTLAVSGIYQQGDAVVLPSFYEGLSNVVCEALSCGRPLLLSNVSDAGNLVKQGRNGFLFDPRSEEEMAGTIEEMAERTPAEREAMGRLGRRMAETIFPPETILGRWIDILTAAAERKRIPIEHWYPEVPESAYLSFK